MTPEEKVIEYLKEQDISPLKFREKAGVKDNGSFEELVEIVLKKADDFASINKDGKQETSSGRWRSVQDIWRHVKFFRPKRTIFAVMRACYELSEDQTFGGQICEEIDRRTFGFSSGYGYSTDNQDEPDEFGLIWKEWEEIGLHFTWKKWSSIFEKEV